MQFGAYTNLRSLLSRRPRQSLCIFPVASPTLSLQTSFIAKTSAWNSVWHRVGTQELFTIQVNSTFNLDGGHPATGPACCCGFWPVFTLLAIPQISGLLRSLYFIFVIYLVWHVYSVCHPEVSVLPPSWVLLQTSPFSSSLGPHRLLSHSQRENGGYHWRNLLTSHAQTLVIPIATCSSPPVLEEDGACPQPAHHCCSPQSCQWTFTWSPPGPGNRAPWA